MVVRAGDRPPLPATIEKMSPLLSANTPWALGLLLATGLAAGCSAGNGGAMSGSGDSDEVVVQLLREPETVPAVTMSDLDGKSLSSTDWQGKVVLVNFWATWCPPCLAEIPDLTRLQEKYGEQLVVVGVSEDDSTVNLKEFAALHQMNYPIVRSTPELQEVFPGVIALPTTFVIDPDGLMVKKHVGLLNARETEVMARTLAGLPVENARIERVDDPNRLSAESAAQITEIPGIDLDSIPAARRGELIVALNETDCTCGCGLSVAKCRMDDPSCAISLPLAQSIADTFATQ